MKLQIHPEARLDAKEGRAFYRSRSPLAAVAFAKELATAIARIKEAPQRYAEGEHGTREFKLPWRFPYTVIYRAYASRIVVIAVAHQSKEPEYWQHRT